MEKEITIVLPSERISAAAGERVQIAAIFGSKTYASIYECENGWKSLFKSESKVKTIEYEAVVHENTTMFVVVTNPDAVARIGHDGVREYEIAVEVVQADGSGTDQHAGSRDDGGDGGETGKLMYKMGCFGDVHFDVGDSKNSEYKADMINALGFFKKQGVSAILSTGDFCEYDKEDLSEFGKCYAGNAGGLPLYAAMGNHDYLNVNGKYKYFNNAKGWSDNVAKFVGGISTSKDGSYCFEKDGDVFVVLNIDYGKSTGSPWDDVSRGFNLLDSDNAYVKQMAAYVSDTPYDSTKEKNLNYQFYSPAVLVWLKSVLEANKGKRVFVILHHPFPHKAGDSDGSYSRLRIWPYSTSTSVRNKFYSGSNMLCGITFWFINKLNNKYKNTFFITGHVHKAYSVKNSVCHNDYDVVLPTGKETVPVVDSLDSLKGTEYDYRLYSRKNDTPVAESGYCISLPSLAKPVGANGTTLYQASQGAIMEVYEKAVAFRFFDFKRQGESGYANEECGKVVVYSDGTFESTEEDQKQEQKEEQKEEQTPSFEGVRFVITNSASQTVRFSGKFKIYTKAAGAADNWNDDTFEAHLCGPSNSDTSAHWHNNDYSLAPGQSMSFSMKELTIYSGTGKAGVVKTEKKPIKNYYGKYFVSSDKGTWPKLDIPAVKLGVAVAEDGKVSNSAFIVHAKPISASDALIASGKTYNIVIDGVKNNYTLDINNRYVKKS